MDDCTFYFTSHVATGAGGKDTGIAAFRFDTCGTDLGITKTDTPGPLPAGDLVRYNIAVTNHGGNLAEDVVVGARLILRAVGQVVAADLA